MTKDNNKIRVNIYLPKDLVSDVIKFSKKIGCNHTTSYIFLLRRGLINNILEEMYYHNVIGDDDINE